MKIFVSNHVVIFILVVTTTIDASRIFYLPLPKIHSSHQQIETPKIIQETTKIPISDEFIPPSAIEQEEIEKRDGTFDWETLLDQEAALKHRAAVKERLHKHHQHVNEDDLLNNKLINVKLNNDIKLEPTMDEISQINQEHFIDKPWIIDSVTERAKRLQSNAALNSIENKKRRNNTLFIAILGTCCAVGVVGLIGAALFWHKVREKAKAARDSEYPSYGVTGPNPSGSKMSPSSTMSDRKLAQSAQMFHYQQQRQQMMAQEKDHLDTKPANSDDSDDEAPAGGDYTVYECPGLAPTGEMEVRNPLFAEPDSSLISSTTNSHYPQPSTSISSSSPPKEKLLP